MFILAHGQRKALFFHALSRYHAWIVDTNYIHLRLFLKFCGTCASQEANGLTRQRLVPSPGALNDREVGGGQSKTIAEFWTATEFPKKNLHNNTTELL